MLSTQITVKYMVLPLLSLATGALVGMIVQNKTENPTVVNTTPQESSLNLSFTPKNIVIYSGVAILSLLVYKKLLK